MDINQNEDRSPSQDRSRSALNAAHSYITACSSTDTLHMSRLLNVYVDVVVVGHIDRTIILRHFRNESRPTSIEQMRIFKNNDDNDNNNNNNNNNNRPNNNNGNEER